MADDVKELLIRVSATTELLRSNLVAAEREVNRFVSTTETATARADANFKKVGTSAGQTKAGMQQLSYQLGDVATMFAMGASPMQIFVSQAGQVSQAVGLMAGGTGGLAAFLGGPWGMAIMAGVTVLAPFIGRLFDTGDAAKAAAAEVYGLKDALAALSSKPMEAMGRLNANVLTAEGRLRAAEAMPRYTGGGSDAFKAGTFAERERSRAISAAQAELEGARMELRIAGQTAQKISALAPETGGASGGRSGGGGAGRSARSVGRAAAGARGPVLPAPSDVLMQSAEDMQTQIRGWAYEAGSAWEKMADESADSALQRMKNVADYEFEERQAVRDRLAQIEARQIDSLAGLYQRAFQGGTKAIWQDFKQMGLAVIAQVLAKFTLAKIGGGGFDLGSAISGAFTSVLGFADGGRPPVGRASIVGERGPELFIPDIAGTIVPNHAMGGGGGVYLTINAPGATAETVSMIRREIANAAPMIASAASAQTMRGMTRKRL